MRRVWRALEIIRERISVVLVGSALWWVLEHLADKAILYAVHMIGAVIPI